MAKKLPYFKFYSSEWNDGDITMYDMVTQAVFINVCSVYWSKECKLSLRFAEARFNDHLEQLHNLIDNNLIINLDDEYLKIRFLDEQWSSRDGRSTTSRINGSKGGRPKKPKKPNSNLTKPNIEETKRREEKKDTKKGSGNLEFNYETGLFDIDIPSAWLTIWAEAYPAVDLSLELKKAQAWLFANPSKRKKDHKRYLNGWFARCQEKGGSKNSNDGGMW